MLLCALSHYNLQELVFCIVGTHVRCVRRNSNVFFFSPSSSPEEGSARSNPKKEGRREYYFSIPAFCAYVGVFFRVTGEYSKECSGTQGEALGR